MKKKLTAVLLSVMMAFCAATMTVYADPDDNSPSYGDNQNPDPAVVTPDPPVVNPDPPVVNPDPPVVVEPDPPVVNPDPVPSYTDDPIDTPINPEPYNPENTQENPQQEIPQDGGDISQEPTVNYDANYYNDMYGGNVISYEMNNDYNDNYQNAIVDNYNPGMTFEEFEKATDYQSATVSMDKAVDMYTSNGSIKEQNLSKKDWQDISLSFDKSGANGTGDFSFIKDNNSDKDSNLSIMFLIVGVLLIVIAVSIVLYMIVSVAKRRKHNKI